MRYKQFTSHHGGAAPKPPRFTRHGMAGKEYRESSLHPNSTELSVISVTCSGYSSTGYSSVLPASALPDFLTLYLIFIGVKPRTLGCCFCGSHVPLSTFYPVLRELLWRALPVCLMARYTLWHYAVCFGCNAGYILPQIV